MTTIRNCKFAYRCDRQWEELDQHYKNNKNLLPEDVRYCDQCDKAVYKVTDDKSLTKAIKLNRCIAIEITEKDLTENMRESWGIGKENKPETFKTMGLPKLPNDEENEF